MGIFLPSVEVSTVGWMSPWLIPTRGGITHALEVLALLFVRHKVPVSMRIAPSGMLVTYMHITRGMMVLYNK